MEWADEPMDARPIDPMHARPIDPMHARPIRPPMIGVHVEPDGWAIPVNAGEAQSTVIAPGRNRHCMNGRFLVSDDRAFATNREPGAALGLVRGFDLDDPSGNPIEAQFEPPPNPEHYRCVSNDHDLISLSNGDVIFAAGTACRAPLDPEPDWFQSTFRADPSTTDFGPGARSNVLLWRSTDGGQTFQWVGEMDPAQVEDGSGALPQFRRNAAQNLIDAPPYDMGGSDGQLVTVDRSTDRLYCTFQCVGYQVEQSSPFILDIGRPLDKTLVLVSDDAGSTWESLGFVPEREWRLDIIPLASGRFLAFALQRRIVFATGDGRRYDLQDPGVKLPGAEGTSGWGWESFSMPTALRANMSASTIAARAPGSTEVVFAGYPDTMTDGEASITSRGYRLFFVNRKTQKAAPAGWILPRNEDPANFIMHLTAVDYGDGPVLLYWYDVDAIAGTAAVRGRLILGPDRYSADFAISRAGGEARDFVLGLPGTRYWMGDYNTADGYWEQGDGEGVGSHHYYPMWPEPDGTIRYTHVTCSVAPDEIERGLERVSDPKVDTVVIPDSDWQEVTPIDGLSEVSAEALHREALLEYSRLSQARGQRDAP